MAIAAEIAERLHDRSRALAARDVDLVMEQVADDIVTFDVGTPLRQTGGAAVRQRLESWVAGYRGPVGFALRDLTVNGEGNFAFSYALVHVTGQLESGDAVSMWVRSTIGWERRDGRWMAVHEHMSDPMDFESGKTRTDLQPEDA